jgi:hypothetical protein
MAPVFTRLWQREAEALRSIDFSSSTLASVLLSMLGVGALSVEKDRMARDNERLLCSKQILTLNIFSHGLSRLWHDTCFSEQPPRD